MISDDYWCSLRIEDDHWWLMMIDDDEWWWMMVYDDLWWLVMINDDSWWFLMIYDDQWWLMMINDDEWWLMMVSDDFWWFVFRHLIKESPQIDLFGGWSKFINRLAVLRSYLFRRYSDRGGLQHGMLRNNIFQWRVNFTLGVIFGVCRPTTGRNPPSTEWTP